AETAHFDLMLSLVERRLKLVGGLSYSTDLFDEATIERMLGHFEVLLEGIVKHPEKRISDLPLLKQAERQQLVEWNRTKVECSPEWNLASLFETQVGRTPEAVALEFEGEGWTYSELNQRANQLAHWLRQMGVGPDVLVGLYLERSLETMVAVLGVVKAGGAYVPLDTAYPQDRLAFMLADANPRVVITQRRLRHRISNPTASILCLDAEWESVSRQRSENPGHENVAENLAYVIYTSGSTGRPKGVAMTRGALANLIVWQCQVSNATESSRTLQFTSVSFDVSFQEIFATWCSGGSLVLIQEQVRRDSLALLSFLKEKRINRLFLPFIALEHLAEAAASNNVLPSSLKEVYTAGEQLIITPKILGLFEKLPECSLHNHYGPSESHVVTAYTLPALRSQWPPRPSIGCPIANCQVYILDTHLQPVPVGVAGELFIGGDCLARGYLDRPELTAEKFIPNRFGTGRLYKTGDLVRYLQDGKIEFLGRSDHQVKLRGFRIELGEIESVLAQHPGVGETVVVVREEVPGNPRLVAYIVGHEGHSCEVGELRSFLSQKLPDYMVPSAYVFLGALPLTASGKVDRKALPAVSGAQSGSSERYVGPRDETERKLTKIWQELLGVERIGIKDNFFDLGGHSLLGIRLIGRVEQELGRTFSLADLFQSPTLESLALNLRKRLSPQLPSLVPFRNFGSKPPVFIYGASFELSRYVDTGQPFFGLEPHGQAGRRAPDTIEAMAADYLQQIRAVQSQGPYFIGGYSIGGPVAYEMAQQLRQGGHEVKLLVLIDPTSPRFWKLTNATPLTSV
ncbi:MAG TPA: amino acid adenylation domain-containing protein, partial [Terriglobia bacterium]|nr:amino acid adenylation domain-containing protein [Terriglobia bacterium]